MFLIKTGLRLISKGVSFATFGIGSLIIGLLIIPSIRLFIWDSTKRMTTTRSLIGVSMHSFLMLMTALGLLSYRTYGLEKALPEDNYLIVANHPSLIDVIFLISLFPQSYCVIKQSIFDNPLTGHVVKSAQHIPNTDTGSMLETSIKVLKSGGSLILFPEGTRSVPGKPLEFKQAAATIAIRSGQKCLPVIIRPDLVTLIKDQRWWHVPAERVRYRIEVQDPIDPLTHTADNPNSRRPDRQFNEFLRKFFEHRLSETKL